MSADVLREAATAIRADNQPWHDGGEFCDDPTCEHMAFMFAVADWLDKEADGFELFEEGIRLALAVGLKAEMKHSTHEEAFAVARAYLGDPT